MRSDGCGGGDDDNDDGDSSETEKKQEMIIAYDFNNYRFKHDWIDKKRALFLSILKVQTRQKPTTTTTLQT